MGTEPNQRLKPEVVIRSTENGPNLVVVDGKNSEGIPACGGSSNEPLCDDTHQKAGFKATATPFIGSEVYS